MSDRVEAMDRRLGGYAVFFITVIGIWLLVGPLAPQWSGYRWMVDMLGSEASVVRFFVAFLFLYFAGIVRDKNSLRYTLHRMMELLRVHLPAQDPEQIRQAVDILIQSLGAENPAVRTNVVTQLQRLTGQDFGEDTDRWRAWWKTHREGFQPPKDGGAAASES